MPPGIEELEMLYAPMKNLSRPLPNVRLPTFSPSGVNNSIENHLLQDRMPRPHPLLNLKKPNGSMDDTNDRGGWKELEIVEDDPLTGPRLPKSLSREDDEESVIRCASIRIRRA